MRARARLSCCIVVAAAVFMAVTASCSVEDGDETSRLPALTLALLDGGGGAEIDLGATSTIQKGERQGGQSRRFIAVFDRTARRHGHEDGRGHDDAAAETGPCSQGLGRLVAD